MLKISTKKKICAVLVAMLISATISPAYIGIETVEAGPAKQPVRRGEQSDEYIQWQQRNQGSRGQASAKAEEPEIEVQPQGGDGEEENQGAQTNTLGESNEGKVPVDSSAPKDPPQTPPQDKSQKEKIEEERQAKINLSIDLAEQRAACLEDARKANIRNNPGRHEECQEIFDQLCHGDPKCSQASSDTFAALIVDGEQPTNRIATSIEDFFIDENGITTGGKIAAGGVATVVGGLVLKNKLSAGWGILRKMAGYEAKEGAIKTFQTAVQKNLDTFAKNAMEKVGTGKFTDTGKEIFETQMNRNVYLEKFSTWLESQEAAKLFMDIPASKRIQVLRDAQKGMIGERRLYENDLVAIEDSINYMSNKGSWLVNKSSSIFAKDYAVVSAAIAQRTAEDIDFEELMGTADDIDRQISLGGAYEDAREKGDAIVDEIIDKAATADGIYGLWGGITAAATALGAGVTAGLALGGTAIVSGAYDYYTLSKAEEIGEEARRKWEEEKLKEMTNGGEDDGIFD